MVAGRVACSKKAFTIAEELILLSAIDMCRGVLGGAAASKLELESLSNNTITYTAHAVAFVFAAIRTTKTREHFADSSYTTQLRVQTMHKTRIALPVASTIVYGVEEIAHFSTAPTWSSTRLFRWEGSRQHDRTRRRLHPHWRISLLQSLCRALGQTEASSKF